ncbi:MAG: hypothetical protein C0623_14160 [Desulfuromonas sp.]|nr:MAG: hypothetical protein C0623_14160 [Desulfuromonas sp.]
MVLMPRSDGLRINATILLAGLFALHLLMPYGVPAAEETAPATPDSIQEQVVYPGLEEVVPRSSQIDADLVKLIAALEEISGPETFTDDYQKARKVWGEFEAKLKEYGQPKDWPVNRLLNVRAQVDNQSRSLKQLLEQVGVPLKNLEEIRTEWTERQEYWAKWRSSLEAAGAKVPRQTFNKVRNAIDETLARAKKKSTDLLQLQEQVSRLREEMIGLRETLDTEVAALRRDPYKRNAHPLFSSDYLAQLDERLLVRTGEGVRAALQFDTSFFKQHSWLLLAQFFLVAGLIIVFKRLEVSSTARTEDWQFIFHRPVSAALFIALAAPVLFYSSLPPPLLQLFILLIATICAARLASELLPEGNQQTLIYILAGFFIVSKTLTTLALPLPLYRLFLVLVSVFGLPFLYSIARRHRKHFTGRFDRYLLIVSIGKGILLVVLIAQISGYATFALQLIESSIGTVFVMIFALMAMRIAEGGIEYFFQSDIVTDSRFVKNLGSRVSGRFSRIARIVITVITLLYLLEIWGLYENVNAAWVSLIALEYSIGEFHISVRMVGLILIVMYSAILLSWFFQSFLETQIFFGKQIDRGVRDAFKKLSHYGFVLVGFIVAMTMAGIELQNFAILAGAFGIGIGFGLQDIFNNFVSGLIMLFERPVKVGDAVIIDGQWGAILKIGMRSTVVETWDRSELIVPNSHMISEKVLNWTLSSNVSRVTLKVGVKYGTDLEKVIEVLNQVGDGHPAVVSDPPPSAIFTEFGDSSINFELRVWVDDIKNRLTLISDLGVAISREFKQAGIEIPFPQRDLHLRSVAPEIDLSGQKR